MRVLEAFIAQHYLEGGMPPLLVVSHAVDKTLIETLAARSGVRATVQHQPREPRRAWLDMCINGAAIRLAQLLAEEGSQQARTRALVDALDLAVEDLNAFRIECFDVSHTAGEATQASCVVFEAHRMQSGRLSSPDPASTPEVIATVSLGTSGKNASSMATPNTSG